MSDTIDCPYCEHEHEPTGCHETDSSDWECHGCKRYFEVEIEYDPNYSTSKSLCEGGKCEFGEWGEWKPYSDREYRGVSCKECDKVKTETREAQS